MQQQITQLTELVAELSRFVFILEVAFEVLLLVRAVRGLPAACMFCYNVLVTLLTSLTSLLLNFRWWQYRFVYTLCAVGK
jgi:hypothetical protein